VTTEDLHMKVLEVLFPKGMRNEADGSPRRQTLRSSLRRLRTSIQVFEFSVSDILSVPGAVKDRPPSSQRL
jgi:hypothetical protein